MGGSTNAGCSHSNIGQISYTAHFGSGFIRIFLMKITSHWPFHILSFTLKRSCNDRAITVWAPCFSWLTSSVDHSLTPLTCQQEFATVAREILQVLRLSGHSLFFSYGASCTLTVKQHEGFFSLPLCLYSVLLPSQQLSSKQVTWTSG